MSRRMKSLLPVAVLALALAGLTPACGHAQSDDERALRRLKEVDWPKAYKEQDVALLGRILADEFQMVDADGNKSTKAQELDWVRNNKPGYDSLTFEITRLDIFENGTAIVGGTGTIRDEGSVTEYQSSNVLVKRDGTWRAVASHVSGVKPKQPEASAVQADSSTERDVAILREKIRKSGEAFNNVDPDAIIAPYARDVVLSYPGVPDMGYETLAKVYAGLRDRKNVVEKTSPTIEEILVSGDLGIIRVMWDTTTTEVATGRQSSRQMKDLQVWRRERDGTWMFIRGMHFRIPPPAVPEKPAS
ncbi:MAG TPA: nuclear transport factor 2 family protein [Thermoanaerobaculia bacterium]|nr:nuclear transport factor 2 family protein [Thermoanaerobaculia bacterium]